jgi:phosphate-selective porin OprO/OprP
LLAPQIPPADPGWQSSTAVDGDSGRVQVTTAQPASATGDSFDSMIARQNERIAEVERGWKLFEKKAGEKKYPNVTVNGVFQADAGWFHQDAASLQQFGRIQDGADFRRFRISAKGSVTETVNYFAQVDFGFFGRPTITDLWLEQTQVPLLGNVRIGQWKQPFSLEVVSSFRYTTFMERSLLFIPFTPFRHIGAGFYDHAEDLSSTWAASVFRSGQDQFGGSLSTDGSWGTAERFTWLPYWECEGRDYLHLGVGHFFNSPPRDLVNFRTIPEFFVGANANGLIGSSGQPVPGGHDGTPFFVATGNLNVTSYNVVGTELMWVSGPLSLQSEAMVNFVNQGAGRPSAVLPGVYAQLGYFLTGEHRPYDRKAGAIDRVIPFENFKFSPCCDGNGWGAWEVAGRFSYLDLNDENIRGGTMMDATFGINWYWNPYTKLVFNYIRAMPDSPQFARSYTDIFGLRAQIDF